MGKSTLWSAICVAILAFGCDDSACERAASQASQCGLSLAIGICEDKDWDCRLGCLADRECETLQAYFDGAGLPPEDGRCVSACGRFACGDGDDVASGQVCDGTEDCQNGADERACAYMTCADGMVVHERGSCEARDARFARLAGATDDDAGLSQTAVTDGAVTDGDGGGDAGD